MAEAAPDSAETQLLLQQARAGDGQAAERLFARHRPYLRQVVDLRLDPALRPRVDPSDVGLPYNRVRRHALLTDENDELAAAVVRRMIAEGLPVATHPE